MARGPPVVFFSIQVLVTQVRPLCENSPSRGSDLCAFQPVLHFSTKHTEMAGHLVTDTCYQFIKSGQGQKATRAKAESSSVCLRCDRPVRDRRSRTVVIQNQQVA